MIANFNGGNPESDLKITRGYENLANAIIITACEDYKALVKAGEVLARRPDNAGKRDGRLMSITSIENFFRSDYFAALTDVDGTWLLRRLKEEAINGESSS